MVNNILPQVKEDILNHNGKLLVRPDSGDMVEIAIKTIESLWNTFGGTVNSKGYKVLDPHIGIIYGDGCTLSNVDTIWRELEKRGFAANNIAYGVGAFCFTAIVENGKMIKCDTAVANGQVTFATNHFSTYVLVEVNAMTSPKTGDFNMMPMVAAMMFMMSVTAITVVRRKTN